MPSELLDYDLADQIQIVGSGEVVASSPDKQLYEKMKDMSRHSAIESWPRRVHGTLQIHGFAMPRVADDELVLTLQAPDRGREYSWAVCNSGVQFAPSRVNDAINIFVDSASLVMEEVTKLALPSAEALLNFLATDVEHVSATIYRALRKEFPRDQVVHFFETVRDAIVFTAPREHSDLGVLDGKPDSVFLQIAERLESERHNGTALDVIYDAIDEFMESARFEELDKFLAETDVAGRSKRVLLALLTATLPATDQLTSRHNFYVRVKGELSRREGYNDSLLYGLEG